MKFALSLLLSCFLLVSLQIPETKGFVNDMTDSLSQEQSLFLDQQLRTFQAMEGVQLIVIVIPSLEGRPIDTTSEQIAAQWQVGPKGHDSGILMLVAKQEGKAYIDLGYGMEANINDDMARKISSDIMDPLLSRGKVYKALETGINHVFQAFGKSIGTSGVITVGSFWDMTALIIFLIAIPVLYCIARFSSSKQVWISPVLGFLMGLTQSIGLAVSLCSLGGLMVLICYVIRTYLPPRG